MVARAMAAAVLGAVLLTLNLGAARDPVLDARKAVEARLEREEDFLELKRAVAAAELAAVVAGKDAEARAAADEAVMRARIRMASYKQEALARDAAYRAAVAAARMTPPTPSPTPAPPAPPVPAERPAQRPEALRALVERIPPGLWLGMTEQGTTLQRQEFMRWVGQNVEGKLVEVVANVDDVGETADGRLVVTFTGRDESRQPTVLVRGELVVDAAARERLLSLRRRQSVRVSGVLTAASIMGDPPAQGAARTIHARIVIEKGELAEFDPPRP